MIVAYACLKDFNSWGLILKYMCLLLCLQYNAFEGQGMKQGETLENPNAVNEQVLLTVTRADRQWIQPTRKQHVHIKSFQDSWFIF